MMQDGVIDKKFGGQSNQESNNNSGSNNKETAGGITQTIKSSEFTKIDHTRSWLSQSSQK